MQVKIIEIPPLMGRREVERFFPGVVSAQTLARLASEGRGPKYLKLGRRAIYKAEDILEWLKREGIEVKVHE